MLSLRSADNFQTFEGSSKILATFDGHLRPFTAIYGFLNYGERGVELLGEVLLGSFAGGRLTAFGAIQRV